MCTKFKLKQGWQAVWLSGLLLTGCATNPPAPVEDRALGGGKTYRGNSSKASASGFTRATTYRVVRGDTLYSIAFRHGVDYQDIARWNHIDPPYTIYVGQKIYLAEAKSSAQAKTVAAAPTSVRPGGPSATPHGDATLESAPVARPGEAITVPPITATLANSTESPGKPTATEPARPPTSPIGVSEKTNGDIAWRWPAVGPLITGYLAGDPMRQGVDIAGKAGDSVYAAANGTVVYSGNGLIGYGELIIVKHSPIFLSAYGHNRKRLVQEGDQVKIGQPIAEMGSSGANREMLHFEIRKNGKPINPTDYLPLR